VGVCVCVCMCMSIVCAVSVPASSVCNELPSTCALSGNVNYYRPILTEFDMCQISLNTLYIELMKMRSSVLWLFVVERQTDMVNQC